MNATSPDILTQLVDFVGSGGLVMWPLAVGTLVLWYALGLRLVTLRSDIVDEAADRGREVLERRPTSLRAHLDEAFHELEERLGRHGVLIRSIVIVAPLAGLLGTVGGMIETFDSLGDMSLFSQSGGIAGGISQALVTTQMGLAVAVPGLVVGRILDNRAEGLRDELHRIKDRMCADAGADTRTDRGEP